MNNTKIIYIICNLPSKVSNSAKAVLETKKPYHSKLFNNLFCFYSIRRTTHNSLTAIDEVQISNNAHINSII
jgi:hypothetical protein